MITLLQLIRYFKKLHKSDMRWFRAALEDIPEYGVYDLVNDLECLYGIELTDAQADRLANLVMRGGHHITFRVEGVAA